MKRGTIVAVCQDGKWSRRVKGVIIGTDRGNRIKVKFTYGDHEYEYWFRKQPRKHGARPCKLHFAGWTEVDTFCPWFSVWKWEQRE